MYFEFVRGPKVGIQRKHFPCELRADIYIFGISGARRMGLATVLIQIPTFMFFAPPLPRNDHGSVKLRLLDQTHTEGERRTILVIGAVNRLIKAG